MSDLILSIVLFFTCVAGHVLFCRCTKTPGLHAKAFGLMAMAGLAVYVVLSVRWHGDFPITAGLIFVLLVPVYLCFYVLTQLTSPSKKILAAVAGNGQMSYAQIVDCVAQEDFVSSRLQDLYVSGCVRQVAGHYILTAQGRKIALILELMQWLMGRKAGG